MRALLVRHGKEVGYADVPDPKPPTWMVPTFSTCGVYTIAPAEPDLTPTAFTEVFGEPMQIGGGVVYFSQNFREREEWLKKWGGGRA